MVATTIIFALFLANWPSIYRDHFEKQYRMGPWLILWGTVTFLIIIQIIPGVGALLDTPTYGCFEWLDCNYRTISSFPLATLSHWSMFTVYFMVVWLVARLSPLELRTLVLTIVGVGVFQAIYGSVVFSLGQETILGIWPKEHYRSVATGTFVNRNHFSGYLELVWPMMLSLVTILFSSQPDRSTRHISSPVYGYLVAIMLSLSFGLAILSSQSRLGIVSALCGVICWSVLTRRYYRSQNSPSFGSLGIIVLSIALIGILWFGLELLITRFIYAGTIGRQHVWEAVLSLPWTIWLTGIGADTFIDFYRTIQPSASKPLFDYAHSDLLEFFLDYGLVGGALIIAAALNLGRHTHSFPLNRPQIGAVSGAGAIAIHSLGDFNLHIPGVAVVFWVFVGIVANYHYNQNHKRLDKKHSRKKRPLEAPEYGSTP
ncbi:MAG: hypothetical protein GKR96_08605 [Gammaproteobacteria bacterium]|nr:hypothetical protein [Gammaproteobacteria bacterium]